MIQKVVPTNCYGDARDDLVSTLALAVLSKEILITEIKEAAKHLARQIYRESASNRFKFRSLDAPVSAENPTPLSEYLVG
jgi:hypothetical protein